MMRTRISARPRVLFSAPNSSNSTQQDARALHEMGVLGRYVVPFGLPVSGTFLTACATIDRHLGTRLAREFGRRAVTEIPGHYVHNYPFWEIPRTIFARWGASPRLAENFYFFGLKLLSRHVARQLDAFTATYAYDNAAVEVFQAARRKGLVCIQGIRSFHPGLYSDILAREMNAYPGLVPPDSRGVDAVSANDIWRREEAWRLADCVIANSRVTRDSHGPAGLDLTKAHVLPLAFPPQSGFREKPVTDGPLRVLWAGAFSAMKGGHHLLAALRLLSGEFRVDLRIFGQQKLPVTAMGTLDHHISVQSTIPRTQLFEEYHKADILVMPSLSDGFGMVVTEAMSQGLPVITTPSAGAADFVQNGVNGIVIPVSDTAALADALRWCEVNRQGLRDMRRNAYTTAGAWQWPDYRKGLAAILLGVIGGAPP